MKPVWLLIPFLVSITLFAQEGKKKVVVIGFDGADYRVVEEMLGTGDLPNLKRLQEMGDFSALTPTNPPQTPVSWSTFSTGINPGRTGIFDFLRRKEGVYLMDLALRGETREPLLLAERNKVVFPIAAFVGLMLMMILFTRKARPAIKWGLSFIIAGTAAWGVFFIFSNWVPTHIPGVRTVRQGEPMWEILKKQGMSASIIRLPITFPAEPVNGEMVAGLVVPDIRGTVGKPSIYTNDLEWEKGSNKFSVEVFYLEGGAPYQSNILGPPNKLFYDAQEEIKAKRAGIPYTTPKDFSLPMTIEVEGDTVTPIIEGVRYPLKADQWSDWIVFNYKVNPLITLKGAGRFYLEHTDGKTFKLYMTPVHPHPDLPLPLTWPPDLAKTLWNEEPYKTMGWALDTWSSGDGMMNEDHFLQDVDLTVTRFEKLMERFLKDNDRDLYVQVFSFTDRVGHILWRYWDEGHPRHEPEKAEKYQKAMRDAYRRMDRIVGRAMELADMENTLFLVCSDHGFSSFRHQFNYNSWLVDKGYMKLKKNVLGEPMELDDLMNNSSPLDFVDWENTKAYAYGLGMMYINLEGREPQGSVKPEEYDALCRQLKEELESYVHEKSGLKPVSKVFLRDEIYSGYDPDQTPDLRVATSFNFRVSWDTTLGGMPIELVEDNPRNWSGDHCSLDPEDVKGILFSSKPINSDSPQMADICPSILDFLEVKHDIDMDGRIIFGR